VNDDWFEKMEVELKIGIENWNLSIGIEIGQIS
jgi:hypothetical protein